jgi:hypothetical protein
MEIKCPHCNQIFNLSEDESARILAQVRTNEFDRELEKRLHEVKALAETETKLKMNKAVSEEQEKLHKVSAELDALRIEARTVEKEHKLDMQKLSMELRAEYDAKCTELQLQVQAKTNEVEYYKDLKARMSTKMVGETLEQHCMNEFDKLRPTAFRNAYFDKDNAISKTGSKGDFIYRDYEDDVEFVSIMFEMKNEMESTEKKHKNSDFFKELDKDRREKGCEYAVLVSMLESDNDLYNQGIVDVSHLYPKMYVVRPQFFIPIITVLRNAALNSLESKKQLAVLQNQDLDVHQFEQSLDEFKSKFSYNSEQTSKRLNESIETIDKAIVSLQKTRDSILAAERQMRLAGDRASNLDIKRLCNDNPTMQAAFDKLHKE